MIEVKLIFMRLDGQQEYKTWQKPHTDARNFCKNLWQKYNYLAKLPLGIKSITLLRDSNLVFFMTRVES